MKSGRVLVIAFAHFVVAMLVSITAFGTDLDQLSSRSALSRAAARVHQILWWPHDTILRALPRDFIAHHQIVTPVMIALNSLAWGLALYAISRLVRGRNQLS